MSAFVHERGICESPNVGDRTRVWAFAHVLPGARIGADCNICDHVFIENDVELGDRVTVKSGVQLWDGIRVADDVFIGPNASFTNDKFPRSKVYQSTLPVTRLDQGCSIGANCTILPGIHVGRFAMVGAGSVVTRDVPPFAVVMGNPARIIGYADAHRPDHTPDVISQPPVKTVQETRIADANVYTLFCAEDLRGKLAVGEFTKDVPFPAKRFFIVYAVPSAYVRGEHAHKRCSQYLVAVNGSLRVMMDDGRNREDILLDSPTKGLVIPPMVWASQYHYSSDAVLLVFASEPYDPDDYIRDYETFLKRAAG